MKKIDMKNAESNLNRVLNRLFNKEQQQQLSFKPNLLTDRTLSWIFFSQNRKYELICNLRNGIVTTCVG